MTKNNCYIEVLLPCEWYNVRGCSVIERKKPPRRNHLPVRAFDWLAASASPPFQPLNGHPHMSRNSLYAVIALFAVLAGFFAFQYYQESRTSGVEVQIGQDGVKIEGY